MATGVVSWSQTAATNANADSTVNFAEGMAPSAVNDSARALMASVAKWRDDLNGSITTGGTSTAYTVTSNQGLALTAGYMIAFVPHTTNGATVTINVDSLGAKPLRSAPGVELPAGVIVQGTPYVATYYTSNSGEWILRGFYSNPYNVPIGGGMVYLGTTAPNSSFALPYGQALSRTVYATLFSQIGTTFGAGDGSTTFNFIDMRGRIPIGQDNMGGTAANRITVAGCGIDGTSLGAAGGGQTSVIAQANLPNVNFNVSIPGGSTGTFTYGLNGVASGSVISAVVALQGSGLTNTSTVVLPSLSGTAASGGSATGLPVVQPGIVVPWVIRIV